MKKILATMILFAASTSFARIPDVRCSAKDLIGTDQIKLAINYTVLLDSCESEVGPVELRCQQNPDTGKMTASAIEDLAEEMRAGCITRMDIPVNIRTENGRTIKIIAKLTRTQSAECAGVELPSVSSELGCSDANRGELRAVGFGGNPRIRDTDIVDKY
ncbi:hypothetical protein D3C72_1614290 [compost metagenome]